jgi:hypothetical protein
MRLARVSVRGLLRRFSYDLVLHGDERITIIHGPNGYGKTTLLKLIDSFYVGAYDEVMSIPFDVLELEFEDAVRLVLTKMTPAQEPEDRETERKTSLMCEIYQGVEKVQGERLKIAEQMHRISQTGDLVRRAIPFMERIGPMSWLDRRTGEVLDRSEIFQRYPDMSPFRKGVIQEPGWLKEHKQGFHVRFIQSQRLLMRSASHDVSPRRGGSEYEYTVSAYAKELSATINRKVAEYGGLTASYERSFPSRFVAQPDAIVGADRLRLLRSEVKSRLDDIEKKRGELQSAGLLDKQEDDRLVLSDSFSDAKLIFLDLYTKDIETKLRIFDDLTPKIKLFTDILNDRFSYKRVSISRERGFLITMDSQGPLAPEGLSSGEQHELVLCFELLFKTGPGYLVMIDEPEISLHVEWQEAFLSDLQSIARVSLFDSLIATHSPVIIGNKWELTESLSNQVPVIA